MNPRTTNRFTGWKMGALISFTCALPLLAEEVDVSKLPAPATVQVDYARDILPILENSCLRCHGSEKPKGDFRLTSRENALKAGDYGANIIPGDSAKSPLIHYVARLVADMEMPPPDKGDPLTPEQVALLRAWIDQDVNWPETKIDTTPTVSIWPTLRYVTVDGNENRFRQHTGLNPGWAGGVEYFRYDQQLDADRKVTMEGHAIGGEESYGVTITLEKRDVGFIRGGAEQYRRYYADTGGYYEPFGLGTPSLGRELYIDVGKAWIEFGLTRPDQPKITLGYEYHYRDGDKSLTGWGPHSDLGTFETRNINPSYKGVDEDVHILRLDLTHDIGGYAIEDNFRAEFYDLTTQRYETYSSAPSPAPPDLTYQIQERHDHFQAANALRAEKQLRDWLLVSGGYLYSYLDGEAFFQRDAVFPGGAPFIAPYSNELLIEQHSHIFNLNAQLGPWEGLTFAAGLQSEWMRQEGLGEVVLDGVTPARLDSNLDRVAWDESFVLRYTTLPYTVLFAETRFQQESIGQTETEADNGGFSDFMRDTDASSDLKEYLAGFQVSPWQRISFTAQYKHRLKQNEYSDNLDESDSTFAPSGNGYSAFITDRDITRDELELKLTARLTSWLKTTLSYEISATDYDTATDSAVDFGGTEVAPGGWVYAGNQDAHTYGLNLVLTPWRRFYVTGALTWQDTRLAAEANGVPSVVPYSGDVYSVLGNATYVLNDKTDLRWGYAFSRADYRQDNVIDGLPVGIEYDWHRIQFGITRQLRRNMTTNLQYSYHHYDEPTSSDANNYRAHLVFATLTIFLP